MKFSVLGAAGFVGTALTNYLRTLGDDVDPYTRSTAPPKNRNLGTVFYCVGVTSDYRSRLLDTAESHVSTLVDFIRNYEFEKLVYLSSTRVYTGSASGAEDAPLCVRPNDPLEVYNLSKLTGESIIAGLGDRGVCVRLSNVLGVDSRPKNFVFELCRQAVLGQIHLKSSLDSRKDYVHMRDVVDLLARIGRSEVSGCYNLAYGRSISNAEIVGLIETLTKCVVEVADQPELGLFPEINMTKTDARFANLRRPPLAIVPEMIEALRMKAH